MPITLAPEVAARLRSSIQRFAAEHLDEEIGDLKASLFLEFCLAEVGAVVYNHAIADAQKFFQDRVTDLEAVCYQPEFSYWPATAKKPRG